MKGKKGDTKTAKAVRILKSVFKGLKVATKKVGVAFKWANENLTMGKVIKWGMILLVVGAAISGYFFG